MFFDESRTLSQEGHASVVTTLLFATLRKNWFDKLTTFDKLT